jgi:hypothetical protein
MQFFCPLRAGREESREIERDVFIFLLFRAFNNSSF